MHLTKVLNSQSIIILANTFNPSVFNQYWLVSNDFIKNDFIEPASIFTPGVANVITKNFNLFVVPEQLQFNGNGDYEVFKNSIEKSLSPILEHLPAIPYKALGLNFIWKVKVEDMSIEEASKNLFMNESCRIFSSFQDNDPLFGAYLSKYFEGFRLNLDIRPIIDPNGSFFQFAFNYHLEFRQQNCHSELIESLKKRDACYKESMDILNF